MKIPFAIAAALLWVAVFSMNPTDSYGEYSHMQRANNPRGCVACHSGSAVLVAKSEQLCFRCHGHSPDMNGRPARNIEREMEKTSSHPVAETSQLHRIGEELPATLPQQPRHVACQDCHLVHITTKDKPWNGVRGYDPGRERGFAARSIGGTQKRRADFEYELCYLCHVQSANMSFDSRDISAEFDTINPSFHPVEGRGTNLNVPSLVRPLMESSIIKCTSCHSSDDPTAPAGPHGSTYEPILFANYNVEDGPEGLQSYALCYECHERNSILGNESFKAHREHVAIHDISCASCHNAHGSRLYSNLIDFESVIGITPASDGMGPIYMDDLAGRPKCYLTCHGADHNSKDINGRLWQW